jgi:hypothetical protein
LGAKCAGRADEGVEGVDLRRFERLLDTHGADLRDWPEGERQEGEALIARSPAAARLHAETAQVDEALRDVARVASPELVDRLLDRLESIPAEGEAIVPAVTLRPWVPAAFLAAMAVIGFLLGGAVEPGYGQSGRSTPRNFVDLLADRSLPGFDL